MVGTTYERLAVDAPPGTVVDTLRDLLRERGITECAVVDHGRDMFAAGQAAYAAWTLVFGNAAAGARLLALDLAAAVDIPLRRAVIGRERASEIVLRDMRTLLADADAVADDFTAACASLPKQLVTACRVAARHRQRPLD